MLYKSLVKSSLIAALEALQLWSETNSGTERGPEAARIRRDAKRSLQVAIKFIEEN